MPTSAVRTIMSLFEAEAPCWTGHMGEAGRAAVATPRTVQLMAITETPLALALADH